MKVNIEAQYVCTKNLRGIPYYIINLVEGLVKRNQNEYAVSFFDYRKERNNRAYIEKYLNRAIENNLRIKECNDINYKSIMDGNATGDISKYNARFYHEYFDEKFDIYHFPSMQNIPQNCDSKIMVTIHDIMPLISEYEKAWTDDIRAQFINSLEYVKKRNDIQIITDSLHTKKDLLERTDILSERMHVVPLAYNPQTHYVDKNQTVISDMGIDKPYVLYLGALDYRKGILSILDAFEMVKERNKDIKLVLAGGLDYSGVLIKERLNNYKYIDDVILPGFVNDEQKRVLMSCAEVFLFPSEYEGFGLPVLEAMACGAPVITTNVSSLPEVGGDAAMYVTPKQPEELANAIEQMLVSECLRQDYIARGFEQCKRFSWDKTAAMTEEVYKIAYDRR